MGEVTKRTGAAKKREAGGEAPILLKDGKTPASESALARALNTYKLQVPPTLAEKLAAVRAHLKAVMEADPHQCTTVCDDPATSECPKVVCECGEVSTYDTQFCPFCGDLGLPPDAQPADPTAAVSHNPQPVESHPLNATSAATALEQVLTSQQGAEPEGGEEPEGAGPDGDDPDAQQVVTVAPEGEVLPPVPADKAAALDAAVERIQGLKSDINKNTWELAAELKRVQDDELYKVRGYENFGAWAVGEVQLSRSLAYELVRVASDFDKQTYLEVGSTKLRLVASIEDPEKRQAALEDAKAGASKRAIEQKHTTRAVSREAPAPESARGKASAPAPEPVKAREVPKKGNEIHLLAKVNGKATTHPFLSSKTGNTVKEYREDAYVELRLADNVVQHIAPKFGPDGKTLVGITVKFIEAVDPS